MDSKQSTAAREDLDTLMQQMRGYPPSRVAAVVWDWMKAHGFRDAPDLTHGSCWDAAPSVIGHDPMSKHCELTAGHLGAHRSGTTEWMHGTPTDDEREALLELLGPILHLPISVIRDNILAAGFRRSEVPEARVEPKHDESCAEWCKHCQVCGEGIRYGSRCRKHYQNQTEPQGEPSDAQVTAEALRKWPHDPNDANVSSARAARRLSFLQGALWMRAALRAAGVVGQEREKR